MLPILVVWGNCTETLNAALLYSLLFLFLYIFFLFPPFPCGWLFRHRYVVVALGLPSARAALPMCRDTLGGAAGLDAQLLWCFLTAAITSRREGLNRSVSRSCAFISGSVVKNKAFQHIKYPFGKWERKAPSPSCMSGCSGQALGEPLPHSSPQHLWVPLTEAWVLWEKVSRGFSTICAGDAATPQTVSLLPLSWRIVATCPGFAQWLLRTWICDWAWRHTLLLLGSPKVALIAEQQRQILGTCSHFPNGEIRN